MYNAALTLLFGVIIGSRACGIWIEIAHDAHMQANAVEHAIVLTAISLFLMFEALLLARNRLSGHSIERLVFHITVLTLTVAATVIELSALKPDLVPQYLHNHSLPLGVEASVGARSYLQVLQSTANVLTRMAPVAVLALRPASLALTIAVLVLLGTRSCVSIDVASAAALPSAASSPQPTKSANAPNTPRVRR